MSTHLTAVSDPDELARIYSELLEPSFPADELGSLEALQADLGDPGSLVLTLRDDEGLDLAVSIAFHDAGAGVLLLAYLAVRPGTRGGGYGNALMAGSLQRWDEIFSPDFVIGEVERPGDRADVVEEHGDPEARLRFYRRFGARRVVAPFFQPGIAPARHRIPMYLMLLHISPSARVGEEVDGHLSVSAPPLRAFIADYIAATEERPPTDPEAVELLDALGGDTVDTVPL
ncbi:hypothetical protein [Tessaracoccus lacteus]|uniref:N-acetyltransferase domain-containing protein n=1 Tax=Tessaracoccus lacteus TaxID=3041766 RepID=A0ABY8Q0D6_9ACTN|nr:hypothetical protein [Tessaracoccus sp. T21]WGT48264.1 hypothetical protein QH948_05805 [Tessaracoccus sp. T21]